MMTRQHLFAAVMIVAAAGASVIALSVPPVVEAAPQQALEVVTLPRVEIVGKREVAQPLRMDDQPLRVVQLPRVEITGKRQPALLAQQAAALRG